MSYQPYNGALPNEDVPTQTEEVARPLTDQECFLLFQQTNEQYWNSLGLSMNHSNIGHAQRPPQPPYYILPQEPYANNRRFVQKPSIVFTTATKNYVRLQDAMEGRLTQLLGKDDAVFSDDTKSQKQSLRLSIALCRSHEKQINVRNLANNSRSITRAKLAEKIAKEIYDFLQRTQSVPYVHPSVRLGPGVVGFERIILIELRHVSAASWQPVLGVLP